MPSVLQVSGFGLSELTPFHLCECVEYMITKLGIAEDKVPEMCVRLYKEYGTTMAGLRVQF